MTVCINNLHVWDSVAEQSAAARQAQVRKLADFARACAEVFYPKFGRPAPDFDPDDELRGRLAVDLFARLVVSAVSSDYREIVQL